MGEKAFEWVPLEFRKWIAAATEFDGNAELVFWRLCLLGYETGSAFIDRSPKRLAVWCKVDPQHYTAAIELLVDLGKVKLQNNGVLIPSVEKRIKEAEVRIGGRRVGAQKARRIGILKREGRSSVEISLIISAEFPDDQAEKPAQKKTRKTVENKTGELLEGMPEAPPPLMIFNRHLRTGMHLPTLTGYQKSGYSARPEGCNSRHA